MFRSLVKSKAASAVLVAGLTLWIVPQLSREANDRSAVRDLRASIAEDIGASSSRFEEQILQRGYELVELESTNSVTADRYGNIIQPNVKHLGLRDPTSYNAAWEDWYQHTTMVRFRLDAYSGTTSTGSTLDDVWLHISGTLLALDTLTESWSPGRGLETVMKDVRQLNASGRKWSDWIPVRISASDQLALSAGQVTQVGIDPFYVALANVIGSLQDATFIEVAHLDSHKPAGYSTSTCDVVSTTFFQPPGTFCGG